MGKDNCIYFIDSNEERMQPVSTILMTFSGTLSVIGVWIKPGKTLLHRISNLKKEKKRIENYITKIETRR